MNAPRSLWTIGHSTREWDVFAGMLLEAEITTLVDVRRFAGSRRNPQYSPTTMLPALRDVGIAYLPMPEFGGRRQPHPDSPNGAWRVAAFRGYADYMATPEFALARTRLMEHSAAVCTAVMCAEALWWRCHRRLIADDFVMRGWDVQHLMSPGKMQPHFLNPAARMMDDVLIYPPEADQQESLL
jgi:uncharacterized protein (DUF488 family)